MIVGNDISKYQGDVDFNVYKNNSNFVIIKATEGTGYIDPKFSRNQSESRRVGLPLGYYHFARPDLGNSPEAEADYFIKTLGEVRDGELLCLDYEPNWNGDAVSWCGRFLKRVSDKLNGLKCLIYMDQSRVSSIDWSVIASLGYGLWIASYTYSPLKNTFKVGAFKYAVMQQWTNSQIIPGIIGKTDGNVFFGTIETLKKYGYKKPTPPTPPTDPRDETIKSLIAQLEEAKKTIVSNSQAYDTQLAIVKADCQKKLDNIIGKVEEIKVIANS